MIITALGVVTDAYKRCNRLAPGETLSDDDYSYGFERLNMLVDYMSATRPFLYQKLLTTAAQTGNITLGIGAWAAIPAGTEILGITVEGRPLSLLTMAQYNAITDKTTIGDPQVYVPDGLSTITFYPIPSGQVVSVETARGVLSFADATTQYTVPPGYQNALGAGVAVAIAPNVLGKIPPELVRAKVEGMTAIYTADPAILDSSTYTNARSVGNILNGWQ